jgi:hypothetical protein
MSHHAHEYRDDPGYREPRPKPASVAAEKPNVTTLASFDKITIEGMIRALDRISSSLLAQPRDYTDWKGMASDLMRMSELLNKLILSSEAAARSRGAGEERAE